MIVTSMTDCVTVSRCYETVHNLVKFCWKRCHKRIDVLLGGDLNSTASVFPEMNFEKKGWKINVWKYNSHYSWFILSVNAWIFETALEMVESRKLKDWWVANFELRKTSQIFLSNSLRKEVKMTSKEIFDFLLTSFTTSL